MFLDLLLAWITDIPMNSDAHRRFLLFCRKHWFLYTNFVIFTSRMSGKIRYRFVIVVNSNLEIKSKWQSLEISCFTMPLIQIVQEFGKRKISCILYNEICWFNWTLESCQETRTSNTCNKMSALVETIYIGVKTTDDIFVTMFGGAVGTFESYLQSLVISAV